MHIDKFDFTLPKNCIAQTPVIPRDSSRCFVIERKTKKKTHTQFYAIDQFFKPGDVLVRNNSKVIPARIFTTIKGTEKPIEILLLQLQENTLWSALIKPGKKVKKGTLLVPQKNQQTCIRVQDIVGNGTYIVEIQTPIETMYNTLENIGEPPLPPYIETRTTTTKDDYQTVYAKNEGSAAAPTAGLHFTNMLLEKLDKRGVQICDITLHVGLGTFQPIKTEHIEDHAIHTEQFEISEKTWQIIADAKKQQRRVIAVGTTSARVLEACGQQPPAFKDVNIFSGTTNIYITPKHQWKIVDGLITNFHLPKSSLVVLVASLVGIEQLRQYYKEAIEKEYRFYSYGDAMFIL